MFLVDDIMHRFVILSLLIFGIIGVYTGCYDMARVCLLVVCAIVVGVFLSDYCDGDVGTSQDIHMTSAHSSKCTCSVGSCPCRGNANLDELL